MQRDGEMKAVVTDLYSMIGLHNRIFVVIHPGARGCAYASIARGGQQYIGYDPACVGPLRNGGSFSMRALNILGHECGHLLGGHVLTSVHSHEEELEADEWAGWSMAKRGATLDEAQTVFRTFTEQASQTHPGRALRLVAVERGWKRGGTELILTPQPGSPNMPRSPPRAQGRGLDFSSSHQLHVGHPSAKALKQRPSRRTLFLCSAPH